jgi:hypothetical protein
MKEIETKKKNIMKMNECTYHFKERGIFLEVLIGLCALCCVELLIDPSESGTRQFPLHFLLQRAQ